MLEHVCYWTGSLAVGYPGGERAFGFLDREISPLSALQQLAPDAHISHAVGDDLTGVPIPSSALTPPSGTGNGLLRTQTTPNTGATQVDPQINFLGANALPAGTAYTWTGTLTVPTTGTYALMLQSASGNTGSNPPVFNRGSITVDGNTVAAGARIELNGGRSKSWSSLLPTTDGLDNARGTINLTAGAHQIKVTATAVGTDPLGVRLNWVTPEMAQVNIDLAAKVARAVRTPVVFAWSTGGGSSLSLPDNQDQLIEAVAAANPRTIVVLNTGFAVTMPWLNQVQSVLEMWDPGQEGGWATADVLLGRVNPSGHLPITFPQSLDQTAVYVPGHPERSGQGVKGVVTYSEGLDVGYRWFDAQGIPPLFPFGYGLSYTTFSFSHLQTAPRTTDGTQEIRVSFDVTNTGGNAGAEVAQVYLGLPASAGEPPKRLVGFERVQLAPGQTQHVTVTLDPAAHPLSSWNTDTHNWAIADGDYTVYLGDSSRTVALTDTLHIHHAG